MNITVLASTLLVLTVACESVNAQPARPPASPDDLSWMVGEWVQCGQGGAVTEEHWVGAGSTLVGLNWSRSKSGRTSWEHLRVGATDGTVTYFASPEGASATPFAMKSLKPSAVVFENPANEFPKRITYRRDGNYLSAQATDLNGRGPLWKFRRKRPGQACPLK